jgi:hypothetical protein
MISFQSLDFYNSNKEYKSSLPKLPENIVSDFEIADWLLNKSNFSWLELDIEIDIDSWKYEAAYAHKYLVPHREENNDGWNSCCIHGIDVDKTGAWTKYGFNNEIDVPYRWTEISQFTPMIKSFWENFPYESYRRIRFMELESNSAIVPHSDMPGKLPGEENFDALEFGVPINVAISHPPDCYMTLQGLGCVPWKEGKFFIVNIRNYHSVINFNNDSRIHLIAHGIPGQRLNDFVKLIAKSYKKSYETQYKNS